MHLFTEEPSRRGTALRPVEVWWLPSLVRGSLLTVATMVMRLSCS